MDLQEMYYNVSLQNILLWAIFGLVVGVVVHFIGRNSMKGTVLASALLGLIGAIVGGYLANTIFGIDRQVQFNAEGFLTALAGGLALSLLSRFFFREKGHIKTTTTTGGK
jgi:uncharacterized membrane protein YeaQ/YmgE (transglycosylase-associated protein family)